MKIDANQQLMLDAGSQKGEYDPEAPDQWKWLLRHGEAATEVAMAWIKSKTTAFRHKSPFCVDEHGNALYLRHMAADLEWEEQTARNVVGVLEKQGRARLDKKRIWYCAYIPQAHEPSIDDGRNKSEETNFVHSYFPAYLVDFITGLPNEKQAAATAKWEARGTWRREFFADGMAALRDIADRVDDITLQEIGLPKKRLPKRRPAEMKWVQLKLLAAPNFVQSSFPEFVQNGHPASYEPQNDFVDARAVVIQKQKQQEAVQPGPRPSSQPVDLPKKSKSSSSSDRDDDEKPRKEANTLQKASPEFSAVVRAAFVEHGKPCPTPRQILNLQQSIPVEEEARAAFLPYLLEKMPRIKHPGSLPAVAEEFTAAWPAIAERERMLRAALQRSNGPRTITASDLRAHLEGAASAIPYPSIAEPLRNLATDVEQQYKDLSSLEERLTTLESDLISQAQANLTKEAETTVEKAIEQHLRPYKGKMTSDQLAMLGKQYRERTVLEVSKLPRLSIFYMHQVAGS